MGLLRENRDCFVGCASAQRQKGCRFTAITKYQGKEQNDKRKSGMTGKMQKDFFCHPRAFFALFSLACITPSGSLLF
jgi:hypothetical protein